MIPWLSSDQTPCFPDTRQALSEPNGLLAVGGELSVDWLLVAYRQGIFPWFSDNEPILWWSPAPRTILLPQHFHSSRSLDKLARQDKFHITKNQSFEKVIRHCALPRKRQAETWIIDRMIEAYIAMHEAGFAHSFECRDQEGKLVGGIYGVVLGQVFFGESMFSLKPNTSKLCLKYIMESDDYALLDCQMTTEHLVSLGAVEIDRESFERLLDHYTKTV